MSEQSKAISFKYLSFYVAVCWEKS